MLPPPLKFITTTPGLMFSAFTLGLGWILYSLVWWLNHFAERKYVRNQLLLREIMDQFDSEYFMESSQHRLKLKQKGASFHYVPQRKSGWFWVSYPPSIISSVGVYFDRISGKQVGYEVLTKLENELLNQYEKQMNIKTKPKYL